MIQNRCFNAINVREFFSSDIPRLSVGFGSMNQVPSRLRIICRSDLNKATIAQFNLPGHSASDMKVTILEKVHSMDPLVRKEREELFIRKFNTKYRGMNNR